MTVAGGGNYQTLINQALRRFIETPAEPIEATLRRVAREELAEAPRGKRRLRPDRTAL